MNAGKRRAENHGLEASLFTAGGRQQETPGWRLKAEMQENRKPEGARIPQAADTRKNWPGG